jgi:hypothetical protein
MPATKKATPATRKRQEHNAAVLDRVNESLEATQKAISSLRGDLGTGASDLRKNLSRLVRDARRDVTKMNRAVRRDLERLQKDLAGTPAKKAPARRPGSAKATSSARSRRPAA